MIRSARRVVPAPVWLIVALYLLVAVCQSAVFPNFRSPDEREHIDLVAAVAVGDAWPWPDPGTFDLATGSAAGGFTVSGRIVAPLHLADRQLPMRVDRESYREAGGADRVDQRYNQLIQHPPLYYVLAAGLLSVYPDWPDAPFDRLVLLLRLFGALLTSAVPVLLWAVARRLTLPDPLPVAAALVPLAVPQFTQLASTVNNDALLVLLVAVLTLLLTRVITGDTGFRTALAVGVLTSLALLTKGFALLIPAWIALVYLVAVLRLRRPMALWSLAVGALATVPGMLWWVRNVVLYGTLQPNGVLESRPDLSARYGWSDGGGQWLLALLERFVTLFFVNDQTGLRERNAPWWLAWSAFAVAAVAVLAVLVLRSLPLAHTVVLLLPVVGLAAIVALGSWSAFAYSLAYQGMQGRYLFGGLVGLGVVVVAAATRLPERVRAAVPLALFGFAVLFQLVYLHYIVGQFWVPSAATGLTAARQTIVGIFSWYALPPEFLAPVVIATLAVCLALLVTLVRVAGHRGEGPPDLDRGAAASDPPDRFDASAPEPLVG
ncbi:MAG: glycosyltransferase family 39 protein [Geodermatophilaceae bacterium]|nr:glycosyltransferase family 39 protein [Geodermatophilaceae bacterium]